MYMEMFNIVQDLLHFKVKPVVVALSNKIPNSVNRCDVQLRACEFIDRVRETEEPFYTTLEDQTCRNGNYYLGMEPPFEGLITGEHNAGEKSSGLVSSPGAFRRLLGGYEIMPTGTVSFISYATLDNVPFTLKFGSQVVYFTCTPRRAMLLLVVMCLSMIQCIKSVLCRGVVL